MNAKERIEETLGALDRLGQTVRPQRAIAGFLCEPFTYDDLLKIRALLQDHILIPKSDIPEGLEEAVKGLYISTASEGVFDYEHDMIVFEAAQAILKHSGGE